jgi:hypothetical protein
MSEKSRARALDPLDPQILLIWTLEAQGDGGRARGLLARAGEIAPNTSWNSRLLFEIFDRRYDAAEALLADDKRPASVAPPLVSRYRALIAALKRRAEVPAAEKLWRDFATAQPAQAEDTVFALGLMGRLDAAFATAAAAHRYTPESHEGALSPDAAYEGPLALFRADLAAAPALGRLRRDQRYMDLMDSSGLRTAWRESGEWPDFCGEVGLPYRCAE